MPLFSNIGMGLLDSKLGFQLNFDCNLSLLFCMFSLMLMDSKLLLNDLYIFFDKLYESNYLICKTADNLNDNMSLGHLFLMIFFL